MKRWVVLLTLPLLLGLLCWGGLSFAPRATDADQARFIPVNLHSVLEADYRQNPHPPQMPGLRLDIIWDALADLEPDATDLAARRAALLNSLQVPVAFVAAPECRGSYMIEADRDTWLDSANPAAVHGLDTLLELRRAENGIKRILLHFPLEDTLAPGTRFARARLELPPVRVLRNVLVALDVFALSGPFAETTTSWSNQSAAHLIGQSQPLPSVNSNIHAWDITGLAQGWLLGDYPSGEMALQLPSEADLTLSYYSRESVSQNKGQTATLNRIGPRLMIDCNDTSPAPQAIAALTPPITSALTPEINALDTPLPPLLPTPSPGIPSPSPGLPTPSPAWTTPTPLPPTPTPPPPMPTLLPSTPTVTPPPPTPTSPPTSPPPTATSTPIPTPTFTPTPTPTPMLSINDVTVTEGNSGVVMATFTVSLSATSVSTISVSYNTVDGTATTADNDYTSTSGTLTFSPGTTTQTINVSVNGDTQVESHETFYVNLSSPVNASLANSQGEGLIRNDDSGSFSQLCTFASQDASIDQSVSVPEEDLIVQPGGTGGRALIQFDLSSIPTTSTVATATLTLYNRDKTSPRVSFEQVTIGWAEGEVTWVNHHSGLPWGSPGGDFGANMATFPINDKGTFSVNLSSPIVGAWVAAPSSNYGLLLRVIATSDQATFWSSEGNPSKQPELCVFYSP